MPRLAPAVPAESDLLCETCGYTLSGLPDGAACPECGTPVASSLPETRGTSRWERRRSPINFWRDTAAVIVSPTRFFRSLTTRSGFAAAADFRFRHLAIASLLFTAAAAFHALLVFNYGSTRGVLGRGTTVPTQLAVLGGLLLTLLVTFGVLLLVTRLAARLSTLEGTYRGYRLPRPAVLRVLGFHAACYLPVGLLAVATTGGYCLAVTGGWVSPSTLVTYLYVLSAEVVLAAGYLFNTYWRAMRATMWANA